MTAPLVDTAMVLAAGLGQRMRPLTDRLPKPLVPFQGQPLIDHVLDRLARAGIKRCVVNAHYFADQLIAHATSRDAPPEIIISDERDALLDTGGGISNALDKLGDAPFITHNSDSVWVDHSDICNLKQLIANWDPAKMDCLMLLADPDTALGYDGAGDFVMESRDGRLRRRQTENDNALVFTGVSITDPSLFQNAPQGRFSMNVLWDHAIAKDRLFGMVLKGTWMHIGSPQALRAAEKWSSDGGTSRS